MTEAIMGWAPRERDPQEFVNFFCEQVATNSEFVSFGEITDGRAISMNEWSPALREVLTREVSAGLSGEQSDGEHYMRIFEARAPGGKLVAYALLSFHPGAATPHIWLQDVVVDSSLRNAGLGSQLYKEIEKHLSSGQIKHLFLESSVRKPRAHAFFHRFGYQDCAIVMSKILP